MASTSTSPMPDLSEETLEICKELQQDELLALESILEERFRHHIDEAGRLVFTVTVEVDLQSECDICIRERALPPQKPTLSATSPAFTPPTRGGKGRVAGPSRRRNGRKVSEEVPPHASTSRLSVAALEDALPPVVKATPDLPMNAEHYLKLRYLPPITFNAFLPSGYPTEEPPRVELQSDWLGDDLRAKLQDRIQPLWQNDSAIYIMVDELQVAMAEEASSNTLMFSDQYYVPSTSDALSTRESLAHKLVKHDRLIRHSTFSTESFDCGICLETKKGARCTRLKNCGHVFCVECLYSFFELNIREGLVRNVGCADMECVKQNAKKGIDAAGMVDIEEVEEIVGKELKERYVWLLEKQKIESDPTITYCPRDSCNAPVAKEINEDYERLRVCTACGYSFCVYCRRTYHGTKTGCVFRSADSIVDKYVNADDAEKAALEHRYGKTNVRRLVDMYLEEQANAQWIKDNSMRCPDCQLDIEKSFGCSHMTCARCQCHFCFRCGARLNAKDPYYHFSSPGSSCFNRLFDYVPSENQEEANLAVMNAIIADL